MPALDYPSDPAEAAFALFLRWFGAQYARACVPRSLEPAASGLTAEVVVGRQWTLAVAVVDTLRAESSVAFEAARAALERRLDGDGQQVALWVPRGAQLPTGEPALSALLAAAAEARPWADGRFELRRTVSLHLRRTATSGSVVTILGGLAASWAQFTNRVPGSFQLNSLELHRLPNSPQEREELAERIVLAAGQPEVDDTVVVPAEESWTVNRLEGGRSYVIGTPRMETDDQSAALRRNLRQLLEEARPTLSSGADARALVVLGAATYAEEEKLSWSLRGMDPGLYGGYDLIAVVADGLVKPLLRPGLSTLPWDVPAPQR